MFMHLISLNHMKYATHLYASMLLLIYLRTCYAFCLLLYYGARHLIPGGWSPYFWSPDGWSPWSIDPRSFDPHYPLFQYFITDLNLNFFLIFHLKKLNSYLHFRFLCSPLDGVANFGNLDANWITSMRVDVKGFNDHSFTCMNSYWKTGTFIMGTFPKLQGSVRLRRFSKPKKVAFMLKKILISLS
jgi:hypothetical protein